MQTAMQELMEWMEQTEFMVNQGFIDKVNECIEKEKKQIIEAYDRGYKACDLDEALEINKTMFSGELYYDKTYKQYGLDDETRNLLNQIQ